MNIIITAIDKKHEDNLINDFLSTLSKFYYGPIAIVDYGLTEEIYNKILKYNVVLKKYNRDKEIVNIRFKDISNFLQLDQFKNITHVMMIDGGDIWFQESFEEIFILCDREIGFVEAFDNGTKIWFKWMAEKINDKKICQQIIETTNNKNILGAGMICGPKIKVINLLNEVYDIFDKLNTDTFGMDMVILNFLIRNKHYPYISLPITYDYNVIRFNHEFINKNGIIYDTRMNKMKIIHNSGNDNRVFKNGRTNL